MTEIDPRYQGNPAADGEAAARADARRERKSCTAAVAYADHRESIREKLDIFEAALAAHACRQGSKPRDWGFPGDLAEVDSKLDEVLRFLGSGPTTS